MYKYSVLLLGVTVHLSIHRALGPLCHPYVITSMDDLANTFSFTIRRPVLAVSEEYHYVLQDYWFIPTLSENRRSPYTIRRNVFSCVVGEVSSPPVADLQTFHSCLTIRLRFCEEWNVESISKERQYSQQWLVTLDWLVPCVCVCMFLYVCVWDRHTDREKGIQKDEQRKKKKLVSEWVKGSRRNWRRARQANHKSRAMAPFTTHYTPIIVPLSPPRPFVTYNRYRDLPSTSGTSTIGLPRQGWLLRCLYCTLMPPSETQDASVYECRKVQFHPLSW